MLGWTMRRVLASMFTALRVTLSGADRISALDVHLGRMAVLLAAI